MHFLIFFITWDNNLKKQTILQIRILKIDANYKIYRK